MTAAEEKKEKISGAAATALFHLLLLLLFILLKLPANEIQAGTEDSMEGITIDFGNTDAGMGETETLDAQSNSNLTEATAPVSQEENPVKTQNMEEAPVIANKTNSKKEEVVEPQPDPNLFSASNKIKNNSSSNNSGEGTSNTPGNMGEKDGTQGALSEGNSEIGNWKLKSSGRKMIGKIEIGNESQETGVVAVEIMVDKYGKVTRATPLLMGSTTTNLYLWNKAKEGLQGKVLFNQSASGEEAKGMIYINFTLR